MAKNFEEQLKDRAADPRALRAGVSFTGDKASLVFGAIGEHPRLELAVSGDEITVAGARKPKDPKAVKSASKTVGRPEIPLQDKKSAAK
jgi:hypothetical protein